MIKDTSDIKLAIIGLGYVGLPLAIEFAKKRKVIGYDLNDRRVSELNKSIDSTLESSSTELEAVSGNTTFTTDINQIKKCNCFVITVPTPIDDHRKPDLMPLIKASKAVGEILMSNDIVIYESTVFPGATEEVCVPILEKHSGLKFNQDFFCGYSPERINPGDKEHRLPNIKKITSGSIPEIADVIDNLYKEIIVAGTHKAHTIKIAEAAKVIENTQRDLNIALINELALIFNKANIDTEAVLEAAGTKWNFLPFRPGLVGGHCIGVDPYYLTYKAEELGYSPEVILAGRRLNDGMGEYVADHLIRELKNRNIDSKKSSVLIMGLSFKENCPDIRNTRVVDTINKLKEKGMEVDIYDPWVDSNEAESEYGLRPVESFKYDYYNAVVITVAHDEFRKMDSNDIRKLLKKDGIIFDLKYVLPIEGSDIRL